MNLYGFHTPFSPSCTCSFLHILVFLNHIIFQCISILGKVLSSSYGLQMYFIPWFGKLSCDICIGPRYWTWEKRVCTFILTTAMLNCFLSFIRAEPEQCYINNLTLSIYYSNWRDQDMTQQHAGKEQLPRTLYTSVVLLFPCPFECQTTVKGTVTTPLSNGKRHSSVQGMITCVAIDLLGSMIHFLARVDPTQPPSPASFWFSSGSPFCPLFWTLTLLYKLQYTLLNYF